MRPAVLYGAWLILVLSSIGCMVRWNGVWVVAGTVLLVAAMFVAFSGFGVMGEADLGLTGAAVATLALAAPATGSRSWSTRTAGWRPPRSNASPPLAPGTS